MAARCGVLWKNILAMIANTARLDPVDLKILKALQENARITTKELAAKVNLSTTPVFERLKRQMSRDVARDFTSVIKDVPQVVECYNISGEFDYLLKIMAPDMKSYNEFIINVLGTIDAIGSIQSTFVMNEIKHGYGIWIE